MSCTTCSPTLTVASGCRAISARKVAAGAPVRLGLHIRATRYQRRSMVAVKAMQGGDGGPKLTRETEPEEYWKSKGERDGANPMKDPLAWVGIIAILLPFVLTLLAIATGVVELP